MDCAFFSDEIISVLEALGIQYTISCLSSASWS